MLIDFSMTALEVIIPLGLVSLILYGFLFR